MVERNYIQPAEGALSAMKHRIDETTLSAEEKQELKELAVILARSIYMECHSVVQTDFTGYHSSGAKYLKAAKRPIKIYGMDSLRQLSMEITVKLMNKIGTRRRIVCEDNIK